MAKVETAGFKGYWELREHQGHGYDGEKLSTQVFRNMVTGEVVAPPEGWNGSPEVPTGDLSHVRHTGFPDRFDLIDWNGQGVELPPDESAQVKSTRNYKNNFDTIQWNK
jgi:hypothetical protein